MKVGAVILTRYNSTRLPGKALMKIQGKPVLLIIVERLRKVLNIEDIVIATSGEISDDPIVDFARSNQLQIYRGSLNDVSQRFYDASVRYKFDFAIRVNGDNVLVDISLLHEMIGFTKENNFDFLSNVKNRTYPSGMSIEIVRTSFYGTLLNLINQENRFIEHVTLYLYENENSINHKYFFNTKIKEAANLHFALDTIQDYDLINKLFSNFDKDHTQYSLIEILSIYKKINNE